MNKLLLTAFLLLPMASNAVEWIDLGKSDDKEVQMFIDFDSIKRQNIRVIKDGGFNSYENQSEYISAIFQPTYINNNPIRKQGIYYTKEQWFISCENESYFINADIDYGFKDEVIGSWQSKKSFLSETDFIYAFPETVGNYSIEQACAIIDMKESYDDLS